MFEDENEKNSLSPFDLASEGQRVQTSFPRISAREQPLDVEIVTGRRKVDDRKRLPEVGFGGGFCHEDFAGGRGGRRGVRVEEVERLGRGVGA